MYQVGGSPSMFVEAGHASDGKDGQSRAKSLVLGAKNHIFASLCPLLPQFVVSGLANLDGAAGES